MASGIYQAAALAAASLAAMKVSRSSPPSAADLPSTSSAGETPPDPTKKVSLLKSVVTESAADACNWFSEILTWRPGQSSQNDYDNLDADGKARALVWMPTAPAKVGWDLVIALLIMYSAVTVPARLAFILPAEGAWWALDVVVSIIFLCDLALNFNTAYIQDGELVTSPHLIRSQYLRTWFWVDAPSALPIELIETFDFLQNDHLELLRLLRLARLARLLRVLKLEQNLRQFEDSFDINLRALRIVKLMFKVVIGAHFLGCGWMAIAKHPLDENELTWVEVYNDGAGMDGPFSQQYLYAFSWALHALCGQAIDINAVNDVERVYSIFGALLGALVFVRVCALDPRPTSAVS